MAEQSVTIPTRIPTPGTPAYWAAQREAFALVHAHSFGDADPFVELDALRRIAAHGFAARVMAAHGRTIANWISSLERITAEITRSCGDEDDSDPDAPPSGEDWCRRGCQPLYRMECGMCGYDGPGVWASEVTTVAEYCSHCRARTYQSPDGICELCGKDAEDDDTPPLADAAQRLCPDRDHTTAHKRRYEKLTFSEDDLAHAAYRIRKLRWAILFAQAEPAFFPDAYNEEALVGFRGGGCGWCR